MRLLLHPAGQDLKQGTALPLPRGDMLLTIRNMLTRTRVDDVGIIRQAYLVAAKLDLAGLCRSRLNGNRKAGRHHHSKQRQAVLAR